MPTSPEHAGRTYPNRPIVGVGAVIVKGDQIVLIKRGMPPREGEWSLPGGGVEVGETTRHAIKREIHEETGLSTDLGGIIDTVDFIERDKEGAVSFHYVLIDYIAFYRSGTLQAGSDADDVRFISFEDALALPLWDETKRIIRAAKDIAEAVKV